MTKKYEEVKRFTKGSSYLSAGIVANPTKVGCPPCDVVYVRFSRKNEPAYTLHITQSEAVILVSLLSDTLLKMVGEVATKR